MTATTHLTLLRNCFNAALVAPVSDITGLCAHLPEICRQTYSEVAAFTKMAQPSDHDWVENCAVMLFGWSPTERRLIALRFALPNNFEPVRLEDGVYTHPYTPQAPKGPLDRESILRLCDVTRFQQEMATDEPDHNAIGGDILLWELHAAANGVLSRVQRVHRFDTYDADLKIMSQKQVLAA